MPGSEAFAAALAETRRFGEERTPEQLRIAEHWADGPGTATPPGRWNEIARRLIAKKGLSGLDGARVLAYLNMAMHDACVGAWDTKYAYWLIRPSQADDAIATPVGLPNFPAYVSGHAAFSGAAAEVLAAFFPADKRELRAMAEEAALSRVYGGIHYRFDGDDGLALGRDVATAVIERMRADGALPGAPTAKA
jgi:membrane-associated phospholipid phosphatase